MAVGAGKLLMKTNVVTLFVIVAGMVLLAVHYGGLAWTPVRIAGVAIGVPALMILIRARVDLGSSFAVRPKATALVTTGIYSKIRNPIYVFSALVVAGVFLYMDRPILLWILAAIIPLQVYRAKQEARVLEERFGEEYRSYRAQTWF